MTANSNDVMRKLRYVLYVLPSDLNCIRAVRLVPKAARIAIQDITQLPGYPQSKPAFLTGVPYLYRLPDDKSFLGSEALQELQRYVTFLDQHIYIDMDITPNKVELAGTGTGAGFIVTPSALPAFATTPTPQYVTTPGTVAPTPAPQYVTTPGTIAPTPAPQYITTPGAIAPTMTPTPTPTMPMSMPPNTMIGLPPPNLNQDGSIISNPSPLAQAPAPTLGAPPPSPFLPMPPPIPGRHKVDPNRLLPMPPPQDPNAPLNFNPLASNSVNTSAVTPTPTPAAPLPSIAQMQPGQQLNLTPPVPQPTQQPQYYQQPAPPVPQPTQQPQYYQQPPPPPQQQYQQQQQQTPLPAPIPMPVQQPQQPQQQQQQNRARRSARARTAAPVVPPPPGNAATSLMIQGVPEAAGGDDSGGDE